MALPGTPGQRISDLCNGNHITQKELAEKIGVSASQLSRIVSGETRTVSSDILIGVAKEFKVSTDYILGLPPLETPTRKGGTLPLHGAHTAFSCYPALRLYWLSKSQRGIGVVSLSK